MGFIKKIIKQAEQAKKKILNQYERQVQSQDPEQHYSYRHIDQNKDILRSSIKFSTYAPLIIQSYILLYSIYVMYTIVKTIILTPIQIILGLFHTSLKSLKIIKTKYVTMHSLVILLVTYIFTLNQDIFDISYMYHLIRGQSTVKVYAIIFALQSSQIVLTKLGIFLYQNIKGKLTDKDIPFYKLAPEFLIESLYVFVHTYFIYVDYIIYSVVLNSSLESFIIFWSVVYLTKMKSTPSFGLDMNKYKLTLSEDAKYRVSRIIYLILFQLSQLKVSLPSLGYKFFFIVFIQQIFIIGKHMIYLLSSYKGIHDTNAIAIRQQMYKNMYLNHQKSSIDRCVDQNLMVLPFVVFCIKIVDILIYSNWQPNFLAFFTFYAIFCVVGGLLLLLIILIKFIEEKAQQIRKKNVPSPFLNSICIDLIGRIIQGANLQTKLIQKNKQDTKSTPDSSQQSFQKSFMSSKNISQSNGMPRLKIKRTSSILDSILLHADLKQSVQQQKQQQGNRKFESKQSIIKEKQQEDDFTDEQLNRSHQKKIQLDLRKSQSHI